MQCKNLIIDSSLVHYLRRLFYSYGRLIANKPLPFLLTPLLLVCVSLLGLLRFYEEDRVWYLYSPLSAPSHREHSIAQQFFQQKGGMWWAEVAITARDSGSLLRRGYLEQVLNVHDFLVNDLTVTVNQRDYTLKDVCDEACDENELVRVFADVYRNESTRNHPNFRTTYPMMSVFDEQYYVGRHFSGISIHPKTRNMNAIAVIALQFHAYQVNATVTQIYHKWGLHVLSLTKDYSNPLINISANSDNINSVEVRENGIHCIPYMGGSLMLMLIFVIVSSLQWADPVRSKPLEAVVGIVGPILAIIVTFGTLFAVGQPFVAIQTVMPFLVLSIGVDDCFIILHAWSKTDVRLSVVERCACTMRDAGPSITITSLTNALSFGIGAFTPTPAIRSFCLFTSVAIVMDFAMQLTLFLAVVVYGGRREHQNRSSFLPCASPNKVVPHQRRINKKGLPIVNGHVSKIFTPPAQLISVTLADSANDWLETKPKKPSDRGSQSGAATFWDRYSLIICKPSTKLMVFALAVVYWGSALYGCLNMTVEMRNNDLYLDHSPLHNMAWLYDKYIWREGNEVSFFVNRSPDFANRTDMTEFLTAVHKFEKIDHSMGAVSTSLWLRSYLNHLYLFTPIDESGMHFYKYLQQWLDDDFLGKRWKRYINFENGTGSGTGLRVTSFFYTTGFNDAALYSTRLKLLQEWRRMADKHGQRWNMTVYQATSFYTDQFESIGRVTSATVTAAVVVMTLICSLFIPTFSCVLTATLALISINIGVFGYLALWGVNLDPIAMATTLMSIGFSVDFTAHIIYHYYKTGESTISRRERLSLALQQIAWPIFQSGISTLMGVIILTAVGSNMLMTFFKTVFLVIVLGLLHSLILLPTVLISTPTHTPRTLFTRARTALRRRRRRMLFGHKFSSANGEPGFVRHETRSASLVQLHRNRDQKRDILRQLKRSTSI